jgi:hypothetical protein
MGQHRAAGRPVPRRRHRASGMVGLLMLGTASLLAAVPAHAEQAPETGQVRLGHLSPSTPAVDVYLTEPGAVASRTPLVADAGYGAVTPYQSLTAGRWTVEMRPAGTSPDAPAPLSAALDVAPGSAQSLLFFDTGEGGTVQGQLLTDDLAVAPAGSGRVRIIQGAEGGAPVEMQAAGGPRLATDLSYGSVTDYATVDARAWDVAIASGEERLQATLDVTDGSVSTVVLTRDAAGALAVTPLADVSGSLAPALPGLPELSGAPVAGPGEQEAPAATGPAQPQGGVPAGGGATAGGSDPAPILLALAGALLLVFGVSGSSPLRRSRHR